MKPELIDIQAALNFYADLGYTLTPLSDRGPKRADGSRPVVNAPGKIPIQGDWQATIYTPFPTAADFQYNFGIVLQADDLVIDVDPRNFEPEVDSFSLLTQKCPELTSGMPSLTVKTGGGGLHIYLKKPREWGIVGALKEFPGVEFKTVGQQVVGGGSTHPDTGARYELLSQADVGPAQAPQSLLDLIARPLTEARTEGLDEYLDDDATIQRYTDYLLQAPPSVEGENGDRTTFSVIARGRDLGLSPDAVSRCVFETYNPRCTPTWTAQDLTRKVLNVYKYASNALGCAAPEVAFKEVKGIPESELQPDKNAEGKLSKTLKNTQRFFLLEKSPLLNLLAFNEFSQDILFTRMPPWRTNIKQYVWNDEEALCCKNWMAAQLGYEPPTTILHEAAVVVSQQNAFHPVKQYLNSLKWDGTKRINTWLHKFMSVEDNEYTRAVGLKLLTAAVSRIYTPGCDFHYIPVFEGKQGTGKSRTLAVLGGQWFSDQTIDVHSRDTIDSMRGKWIIEVSEMECARRTDTQALKAFLSRPTDRARLAYMRCSKDYPRQCIFVGTINPESDEDIGYLRDTTGNRRYWPVKCGDIHLDALAAVRHQIWAEAVVMFNQGVPIYFEDRALEEMANAEQKKRVGRDAWTDKVDVWLKNDPIFKERMVVTSHDVFCDCIGGRTNTMARREQSRIAQVMADIGWERGTFYHQQLKQNVTGYRRPMIE